MGNYTDDFKELFHCGVFKLINGRIQIIGQVAVCKRNINRCWQLTDKPVSVRSVGRLQCPLTASVRNTNHRRHLQQWWTVNKHSVFKGDQSENTPQKVIIHSDSTNQNRLLHRNTKVLNIWNYIFSIRTISFFHNMAKLRISYVTTLRTLTRWAYGCYLHGFLEPPVCAVVLTAVSMYRLGSQTGIIAPATPIRDVTTRLFTVLAVERFGCWVVKTKNEYAMLNRLQTWSVCRIWSTSSRNYAHFSRPATSYTLLCN